MGNFVLPNFSIPLPTRLFAKSSVIHEHSRRAVEHYSNFWVRTRPRKTPPFLPPRGEISIFAQKASRWRGAADGYLADIHVSRYWR